MAKLKEGDWVRAADPCVVQHWNQYWAKRSGVTADMDTPFKIAEVNRSGNNICAGSTTSGPYWRDGKLEPWTPRVGEKVRFVRDNSDGGAQYGAKGDVVAVSSVYGESVNVRLESLDWTPRALLKEIEPVTGKAVDAPDAPKFKVGDRVRVTKKGNSGHGRSVGEEFTLSELSLGGTGGTGGTSDGPDFYPDEIELVDAPAPLKIEAGKFYKTRDGRKVGPMDSWSGSWNGWFGDVENDEPGRAFQKNGKHGSDFIRNIPGLDLIAEASTPPTTTAATGTAIVCLIRDGKPLPSDVPRCA